MVDQTGADGGDAAVEHPSFADLRGAARFTLLIRTAKLRCGSGEYLCVVRDVSATGVRLRLFHPLPPLPRMTLELSNGELHLIEPVWERDRHAGFRFCTPGDVEAFIAERGRWPRRPLRLRLELPAMITADGVEGPARLCDLSQQGARIECEQFLAIEQKVKLAVAGLPSRIATVCWRSNLGYGVVFQQSFALDELARLVDEVQREGVAVTMAPDDRGAAVGES